jgi:hypothetical protein
VGAELALRRTGRVGPCPAADIAAGRSGARWAAGRRVSLV